MEEIQKTTIEFSLIRVERKTDEETGRVSFESKLYGEYEVKQRLGVLMTTRKGRHTYYLYSDELAFEGGEEITLGDQDGSVKIPIDHYYIDGEMIPDPKYFRVVKADGQGEQYKGMVFKRLYML